MKSLNSLFLAAALLMASHTVSAQLSTNDQLWNGGLSLFHMDSRTTFQANPSVQHFLSPRFSIGGQLGLNGSTRNGLENILLAPEMRYYLNPEAKGTNWFLSLSSPLEIYENGSLVSKPEFQLQPGLGSITPLNGGLALESNLSFNFRHFGSNSFFEKPRMKFELGFVHLARSNSDSDEASGPRLGRGSWLLGGQLINAEYANFSAIENFSIGIAPSAGYFLTDRLVAGMDLSLTYNYLKTDFTIAETNIHSRTFGLSVNPFLRYYTARPDNKIQPYLELRAGLNYQQIHTETGNADPLQISRSFSAGLGGGVNIFINRNTALELGLNLGVRDGQPQFGFQTGLKFFLNRRK
ncbi:outer membrane beta-barrel protein [Flavilitoribacter nigricans]|uniref:Uncharacterized protein n=1 Tax=Flavilitoribacter nigricans (strain ATCC 23147 / DSM 23189 / NBRC 102662 / NCIMB 1420 / SS-2) TaxID=1122177 RepID=A0A2D0N2N7_FLAN2|nr:outer membrane beta-barrel protein [Flavilitoribacter nigricans]PHN02658.1 hypothetical protein CRP01_31175 [Flavilitoribacter nigricans DSM 23189 = NBRC 102662]